MPTRAPTHKPPGHRPARPWQRDASETASHRGYGHRWGQLRRFVLQREPLCRPCFNDGRITEATEVDHIVPKSSGGLDEMTNLQPICAACHRAKTLDEARAAKRDAR